MKDKSFAFYLKNETGDSIMTIPGKLEKGYSLYGKHNVAHKSYWNVDVKALTQAGKKPVDLKNLYSNNPQFTLLAAVDSGSSAIVGPEFIIKPLIDGIKVASD